MCGKKMNRAIIALSSKGKAAGVDRETLFHRFQGKAAQDYKAFEDFGKFGVGEVTVDRVEVENLADKAATLGAFRSAESRLVEKPM